MTHAIYCENLQKTYEGKPPVHAVRGLNLTVSVGECFGLLGPNGAGKTTAIEILEGLLKPTSGTVQVLGHTWGRDDQIIKQRIGISLQETQLSERLSVRETLTLFRSFYETGIEPEDAMRRVSLEEKTDARVGKLSGGQKQRLAVATALVGNPDLLFLDEPTTGLDPTSRRQLWDIIRTFRREGRTILLTTHYMEEAERLCDRVAIVDQGKVIAQGSPRELIASLGGEHVIEFSTDTTTNSLSLNHEQLRQLPSVLEVRSADGHVSLSASEPHLAIPALLDHLQRGGYRLSSLTTRHASLEDVFVRLTGRHLQEEQAAA